MARNAVIEAFDEAKDRYDSLAIVCGILDISSSYAYKAMTDGELSLPCALKMEVLLDGKITWGQLCPRVKEEVQSVAKRMNQYAQ